MISIEAWRGRIGGWNGRVKLSSSSSSKKLNFSLVQTLDVLWGISTILVATVITLLLIVGGVEVNPGPPRKDPSTSCSEEDIEVPKTFDFGETAQGTFVFTAPVNPKIMKRRVVVGSRKRPKFGGHIKRDKVALAHEYVPVSTNSRQTSVTESLDVLELSAKVPRISVETQNETIPFLDSQENETIPFLDSGEHQEILLPETQPKLATAESKISKLVLDDVPFEEMEVFVVGKSRGDNVKLCRVGGNALLNIGILEGALAEVSVCKLCSKGRLTFYRTSYNNGLALHHYNVFDQCLVTTPFYTLPQNSSPSDTDNTMKFGHNILQIWLED